MVKRYVGRTEYSRAERWSDAAVHFAGVVSALIAVPVLVTLAAVWRGDATAVAVAVLYGLTLIGMVSASALYHITWVPHWKRHLKRCDHVAIYCKIAGTYTPLLMLSGTQAGGFLAGLWLVALAGSSLKVIEPDGFRPISLVLYLGMGWAGAVFARDMFETLSPAAMHFVIVGGLLYTIGFVFFLWEALPFHNTIWHVFVLLASGFFYAAVMVELGQLPPDLPAEISAGLSG